MIVSDIQVKVQLPKHNCQVRYGHPRYISQGPITENKTIVRVAMIVTDIQVKDQFTEKQLSGSLWSSQIFK